MSDDLLRTTAPSSPPTQQVQPSVSQAAPAKAIDNDQKVTTERIERIIVAALEAAGLTIPRDLRAVPAERDVYSVGAFCARHSISRDMFYVLQGKGLAPETVRIGNRQLVTKEAAARWRKSLPRAEHMPRAERERKRKRKEG